MGRAIAAVVVAFMLWPTLWLGFNKVMEMALPDLINPPEPLTHAGVLIGFVVYSAVISAVAGYACAAIRKESPMKTVWVFAIIQLAVGVFVEISYWALMPVWYHLVFLALIVPATVWGGTLRAKRSAA